MAHVVALLLLAGCRGPFPAGDPERPDIVLVSIDSLRPDRLSAYGHPRDTSPALEKLAARGLRFTEARAASPWTLPSHVTMLTGRWPTEHGVVDDGLALAPDQPWLPERLRDAGYATAGFVSTIYVSRSFGFDRGFDRFDDYGITEQNNLAHPVRIDRLVQDATAWMVARPPGEPAFLFLHTYDVHYPYLPPERWNTRYDEAGTRKSTKYRNYFHYFQRPLSAERIAHLFAQYDESIRYVDDHLGPFFRQWTRSDRDVWVFVTADHGEEIGERGSWGHAHTLTPEQLDIPLIVAGPGVTPAVRDDRVGTIDLAATAAAIAGLPWSGDGHDLRAPVPARRFWAETSRKDTNKVALLDPDVRFELDLAAGARHLWDLTADPDERTDLAATRTGQATVLERALYAHLGEHWTTGAPSLTTDGAVWRDGEGLGDTVPSPGRFGLWPPDAELRPADGPPVKGVTGVGPGDRVAYDGPRTAVAVTLDDATRAQLEALGYLQGSEPAAAPEGDDDDEATTGP